MPFIRHYGAVFGRAVRTSVSLPSSYTTAKIVGRHSVCFSCRYRLSRSRSVINRRYASTNTPNEKTSHNKQPSPPPETPELLQTLRSQFNRNLLAKTWEIFSKIRQDRSSPAFQSLTIDDFNTLFHQLRNFDYPHSPPEKIESLFDDMRALNINPNKTHYHLYIEVCSIEGKLDKCVEALSRMKEERVVPSLLTYNYVVRACMMKKDAKAAENVVKGMLLDAGYDEKCKNRNVKKSTAKASSRADNDLMDIMNVIDKPAMPDGKLLSRAVMTALLAEDIMSTQYFHQLVDILQVELDATTLPRLLDLYVRGSIDGGPYIDKKLFQRALDIYHEMITRAIQIPESESIGLLVDSLSRLGRIDEAIRIIQQTAAMNVKLESRNFGLLIDACLKHCHPEKAFQLYTDMKRAGIVPIVETFNNLLTETKRTIENEESYDTLKSIYGDMQILGVKPNKYTYAILFTACAIRNDLATARQIYDDVKDATKLTEQTYGEFIGLVARKNDFAFMESLINKTRKLGYTLDRTTLKSILEAHLINQDFGEAEKVISAMIASDSIYLPAIEAYVRQALHSDQPKPIECAFRIFNTLLERGLQLDKSIQSKMIPHLVQSGQLQTALDICFALAQEGTRLPESTYRLLLLTLLEKGLFAESESMMKRMRAAGYEVDADATQVWVATRLAAGDVDEVFHSVLGLTEQAPLDVQVYNEVVKALLERELVRDVIELYRATNGIALDRIALIKGRPQTVRLASPTLAAVAKSLAASAEKAVKESSRLLDDLFKSVVAAKEVMSDPGVRREDRAIIERLYEHQAGFLRKECAEKIEQVVKEGGVDAPVRAHEVFRAMGQSVTPTADICATVMRSYALGMRSKEVVELHDEMIKDGIKDNNDTISLYVTALLDLDSIDLARRTFMQHLSEGWCPEKEEAHTLIEKLMQRGQLYRAQEVAKAVLETPAQTIEVYDKAIHLSTSLAELEGAMALLKKMQDWREKNVSEENQKMWTLGQKTVAPLLHALLLEGRSISVEEVINEIASHKLAFLEPFYLNTAKLLWRAHSAPLAAYMLRTAVAAGYNLSFAGYEVTFRALIQRQDFVTAWKFYKSVAVERQDVLRDQNLQLWSLEEIKKLVEKHPSSMADVVKEELEMVEKGNPIKNSPISFEKHGDVESRIRKDAAWDAKMARKEGAKPSLEQALIPKSTRVPFQPRPEAPVSVSALIEAMERKQFDEAFSIAYKLVTDGSGVQLSPVLIMRIVERVLARAELVGGQDLLFRIIERMVKLAGGREKIQKLVESFSKRAQYIPIVRLSHALKAAGEITMADEILDASIHSVVRKNDHKGALVLAKAVSRVPPSLSDLFVRKAVEELGGQGLASVVGSLRTAGVSIHEALFERVVKRYVDGGKRGEVGEEVEGVLRRLWKLGMRRSDSSLQTLLYACAHGSPVDLPRAQKSWKEFVESGGTPDPESYRLMFAMLVQSESFDGAKGMLSAMKSAHIHPEDTSLRLYIESLVKAGHAEEAFSRARDLVNAWIESGRPPPPPLQLRTVSMLLKHYAIQVDHGNIRKTYDLCFDCGFKRERIKPALLDIISTLLDEGKGYAAGQLYRSLGPMRKGVWDCRVHDLLISYWSQEGDFRKMEDAYLAVKEKDNLKTLRRSLFEELIQRHAQRGIPRDLQFARRIYNDLTQQLRRIPSRQTMEILVKEHARSWDQDSAELYLSMMKAMDFQPAIGEYNAIMEGWGTMRRSDRAERWLRYMVKQDVTPDKETWFGLCWAWVGENDLNMVESVLMRMGGRGFKFKMGLVEELGRCAKTNDVEAAKKVWGEYVTGEDNGKEWGKQFFVKVLEGAKVKEKEVLWTGGKFHDRPRVKGEHPMFGTRRWVGELKGLDPEGETGLMTPKEVLQEGVAKKGKLKGFVHPKNRLPTKKW